MGVGPATQGICSGVAANSFAYDALWAVEEDAYDASLVSLA